MACKETRDRIFYVKKAIQMVLENRKIKHELNIY